MTSLGDSVKADGFAVVSLKIGFSLALTILSDSSNTLITGADFGADRKAPLDLCCLRAFLSIGAFVLTIGSFKPLG